MTWEPIDLPKGAITPEDSDTSVSCAGCGACVGEPCKTAECGTWGD